MGTEPLPAGTLSRRCRHCGGPIPEEPGKVGAKPQFCGAECRVAAFHARTRKERATGRTCQRCGVNIDHRAVNAKFCGEDCSVKTQTERAKAARRAAAPPRKKRAPRRRFEENPEWKRPTSEARRLARRVELDGRLRAIEQGVADRFRERRAEAVTDLAA